MRSNNSNASGVTGDMDMSPIQWLYPSLHIPDDGHCGFDNAGVPCVCTQTKKEDAVNNSRL